MLKAASKAKAATPFDSTSGQTYCTTCGQYEPFENCRMLRKGDASWRCSGCKVKIVQLYRGYGSWPPASFASLTTEDQQSFFQKIKTMDGKAALKEAEDTLGTHEVHEEYYQDGGEYLPLGVWAHKGFDVSKIEAGSTAADIRQHPVLGQTYRIRIFSAGHRGNQGSNRTSVASAKRAKIADVADVAVDSTPGRASTEAAPSKEDPSESASSSESDSSCSSSSDKKKKSKKHKKHKKNKKADKKLKKKQKKEKRELESETPALRKQREKMEKAEKKEADKAAQAAKTVAQGALNKITGALLSLQTVCAKPGAENLPTIIMNKAKDCIAELEAVKEVATDIIADPYSQAHNLETSIPSSKDRLYIYMYIYI